MRNRLFAVLALAVIAGGGLAFATYRMQGQPPQPAAAMATQPIVIAAADLQLGAELRSEDLRVINFPQGQAPEGSFAAPTEIVGRGVISPMVKGEPILPGKLASKEAGAGLPTVIPEGMRAVSVRVNEVIGVAGYVLPGTRVDVVATGEPEQPAG
jgi:pilus assembly protein CpaB